MSFPPDEDMVLSEIVFFHARKLQVGFLLLWHNMWYIMKVQILNIVSVAAYIVQLLVVLSLN